MAKALMPSLRRAMRAYRLSGGSKAAIEVRACCGRHKQPNVFARVAIDGGDRAVGLAGAARSTRRRLVGLGALSGAHVFLRFGA